MDRDLYQSLLDDADARLRAGDYDAALPLYAEVARAFARDGFVLKAVAVWKQVRAIVEKWAPLHAIGDEARDALVTSYRTLGLHEEAARLEAEKRTLH